jgi:rhodanese-related sulfurtransferase
MPASQKPSDAAHSAQPTEARQPAELSARSAAVNGRARQQSWKRRLRWVIAVLVIATVLALVGDLTCRSVGPIVPPPAGAEPGRWVFLEGAANTRDIGGYRIADGRTVRRGRAFRSGNLGHLSSAGVRAFRELGITTVVDLRHRLTPLPWCNGDVLGVQLAASVYGCPMSFAEASDAEDFYVRGVQDNAASFRRAFEILSQSDGPVLFHCAGGVDRSGVVSALLLRLLGVSREDVLADFRLSEQVGGPGKVAAMNRLLDEVERAGGIERYLLKIGVSSECQSRLRQSLLESPPH